jgi:hypothetical protein
MFPDLSSRLNSSQSFKITAISSLLFEENQMQVETTSKTMRRSMILQNFVFSFLHSPFSIAVHCVAASSYLITFDSNQIEAMFIAEQPDSVIPRLQFL